MNTRSELEVTLSAKLLDRLRTEAKRLGIPVEWLVASLVVDTVDERLLEPVLA